MEKAYSLKALGQFIALEAKQDGLELAEESIEKLAKAAYAGIKSWAKISAAMSENVIDDVAAKFYDYADPYVLPQIEALDLNKDGK